VRLPAHNVPLLLKDGNIEPTWYQALKQIEANVNYGTIGQGLISTTATSGFGFLPTCAGPPTGVPVSPVPNLTLAQFGFAPCVFDTVNNKLWVYNGAWKGVVLT